MLRKQGCRAALIAVLLVLAPLSGAAQPLTWSPIGPWGGELRALAFDPQNADNVYAGSGFGVFKSTDGGALWARTPLEEFVYDIVVNPTSPAQVFAGSLTDLYESSDAGATWAATSLGAGVAALAFDPSNPAIVYAGERADSSPDVVFKSSDGGATWASFSVGFPAYKIAALDFAIDPGSPTTVYAATGVFCTCEVIGVFKSLDGGTTWARSDVGLPAAHGQALAMDPSNPSTLYLGTSQGVYKSTDAAGTWSPATAGISGEVQGLVLDPQNPLTLYATTVGGSPSGAVFKSVDAGLSWLDVTGTGLASRWVASAQGLVLDPQQSGRVILATESSPDAGGAGGLFESLAGGGSWTRSDTGITNFRVRALGLDPQSPATLFAGVYGGGVFRSGDRGASWSGSGPGLAGLDYKVIGLAVDPANPATLYAAGGSVEDLSAIHGNVLVSVDSAASWSATGYPGGFNSSLGLSASLPSTLFVGTRRFFVTSQIQRSLDSGASWSQVFAFSPSTDTAVAAIVVDPTDAQRVYAASLGTVLRSLDGGTSWLGSGIGPITRVRALAIDPGTTSTLYAGVYSEVSGQAHGVYKSLDSGVSWNAANSGLSDLRVLALAVDPQSPAALYAATNGGGIFRSLDGAGSWTAVNSGLTDLQVESLQIDPTASTRIYAGTRSRGIFAVASCGDGLVAPGESCDDGNTAPGDGCGASCGVESCYGCLGEPSLCSCQVGVACGQACFASLFCSDSGGACQCAP